MKFKSKLRSMSRHDVEYLAYSSLRDIDDGKTVLAYLVLEYLNENDAQEFPVPIPSGLRHIWNDWCRRGNIFNGYEKPYGS